MVEPDEDYVHKNVPMSGYIQCGYERDLIVTLIVIRHRFLAIIILDIKDQRESIDLVVHKRYIKCAQTRDTAVQKE